MASKPTKKRDDVRIKAMLDGMIADARSFDDSERRGRRENALAYQAGDMPDLAAEEGRSAVVEQILADTMAMLLPSLSRVFLSSDRVAIYEPVPPAYVEGMPAPEFEAACERVETFAEQATDYVNFVFLRECQGEKLLRDAIYDGLLHGNAIIKHWWDATPEHVTESYSGLSEEEYLELVADPDVEVLEHSEKPDPDAAGAPVLLGAALGEFPASLAGSGVGDPAEAAPQMPMADGGMEAPPPIAGDADLGPDVFGLDALGLGADAAAGLPGGFAPPLLHDLKIRRVVSTGRLRVKSLADEDFLIESNATALNEDECRFCAHLDTPTRSNLIERGYDKDLVFRLGAVTDDSTEAVRRGDSYKGNETYEDKAGERVQVYECYALLDPDEDGIAEWFQIVVGGPAGSSEILEIHEWGGKLPFSDIVPDPVPHIWRGRSMYDRLRDPQRVATAFSRRINDNLYMTVEPMRAVDMTRVENPDVLFDMQIGGTLRTKGDPRAAVMDLTMPFIAKEAVPMVQEQRAIAERRTGVGEQSSGLDVNAMTNQVATAVAATQSAAGARKEEYARNIAIGLRRVFGCMLRLMVENQDRTRLIRLRGTFVPMNPQAWSAEMDVDVNVGLGAGNRDRDLAMLQGIYGLQKEVAGVLAPILGPDNDLMGLKHLFETGRLLVEASGVKGAERFFPEIGPEVRQAMQAAMQAQSQQPDPRLASEQAKLQMAQEKAQADARLAQAKAQADVQLQAAKAQQSQALAEAKLQADLRVREAEMAHRMEMDRVKAQQEIAGAQAKAEAELQVQQAKHAMQMQMQREKAAADLELRTRELQLEAQLKAQQQMAGINVQHTTDLQRPI